MTPRRTEIEAAIATHNASDGEPHLPPSAARLLAVMFPRDTVCCRSVPSLAAEGFDRRILPHLLESLIDAGFLSKELGRRGFVGTYYLHLPPRRQP